MRVYVAAPYRAGALVAAVIHPAIWKAGAEPVSAWAEGAAGPEDLGGVSVRERQRLHARNHGAVRSADVVLVYDPHRMGRETYAEAATALLERRRVLLVGEPTLSLSLPEVEHCADLEAAIRRIEELAREHDGYAVAEERAVEAFAAASNARPLSWEGAALALLEAAAGASWNLVQRIARQFS